MLQPPEPRPSLAGPFARVRFDPFEERLHGPTGLLLHVLKGVRVRDVRATEHEELDFRLRALTTHREAVSVVQLKEVEILRRHRLAVRVPDGVLAEIGEARNRHVAERLRR